ncbi:MAG: hypothetical protein AAF567_08000 [Actinomycetota bacterium]
MDSTDDGTERVVTGGSAAPDTRQLQALHVPESTPILDTIGFGTPYRIGSTALVPGAGELAATIDGIDELDGLRLRSLQSDPAANGGAIPTGGEAEAAAHPNGVVSIDHVVVMTPNADRTHDAFAGAGIEARRVRRFETKKGTHRQTFYWLGDVICEVAGADDGRGDDPASWWGLALTVADIESTAAFFGDSCTPVKDAVQPGRKVTTLRSPDSTTPILFISEHVR